MRHQRQRADGRRAAEPLYGPPECRGFDAEPPHAGVDLEPAGHGGLHGGSLEQRHVLVRVHDHVERKLGSRAHLARRDATAQDDETLPDAGLTQLDRFLDAGHRKRLGVLENARDLHQPVAVGVCLDDGQHRTARRQLPDPGEVAAERCRPDDRDRGRGH